MSDHLFSDNSLARFHEAAVRVLSTMGYKVENEELLRRCEKFGCQVDYAREVAVMPPEVIQRALDLARNLTPEGRARREARHRTAAPGVTVGAGGTPQVYLDPDTGDRRPAKRTDLERMFKLAASLPGVGATIPPVIMSDSPPLLEAIEAAAMMIELVPPERVGAVETFHPSQLPFIIEIGEIFTGKAKSPRFVSVGNCPTSPLIFGRRTADLALARSPYNAHFALPTMPLSGANAPITRAGTIVIGVAEIVGGCVIAKAMREDTSFSATTISGILDMRTGRICFCTPEVVVQDLGIYETCDRLLELPMGIYPAYVDAKVPGMQAVWEKTFKQSVMAKYAYWGCHDGSLDAAKVCSPLQIAIDVELARPLEKLYEPVDMGDEALAVDLIREVAWESGAYMSCEQTVSRSHTEFWYPAFLDRTNWTTPDEEAKKSRAILERANDAWRDAVRRYTPPALADDKRKALRTVVERARKVLA
ncbi:MAG: trimethylamine methyltransferase family protein [Planctomycetota bacterium]